MQETFFDLGRVYGPANVAKLASAYEAALLAASPVRSGEPIDREVRLAIVRKLIREARNGRFETGHLTRVAVSAVVRDTAS